MQPTTVRLDDETLAEVDTEAKEQGLSRSDYIRELIKTRHDYDRLQNDYEEQLRDYEQTIERLQNEKRLILEQREEHTELVEYVEEERSMQRRREDREQRRAQAGVLTRTKWWLTGMPDDDADGEEE